MNIYSDKGSAVLSNLYLVLVTKMYSQARLGLYKFLIWHCYSSSSTLQDVVL